jgi:hypothetical protein
VCVAVLCHYLGTLGALAAAWATQHKDDCGFRVQLSLCLGRLGYLGCCNLRVGCLGLHKRSVWRASRMQTGGCGRTSELS